MLSIADGWAHAIGEAGMHYDVTIITVRPGAEQKALVRLRDTLPASDGLLACWCSDIGALNRILLLRAASDITRIHAEREKILRNENPFGVGEYIVAASSHSCRPWRPGNTAPYSRCAPMSSSRTAWRRPSSCGASGCPAAQKYRRCSRRCIRSP